MSMLKKRSSFSSLPSSISEREAEVAVLACVVDGHNVFVFNVIAFLARSGCHTCKNPVSGTAIRRPFGCGAIIVVGGLQS